MIFASPACQHSFVGNTRGRYVPLLFKACRGRCSAPDAGGDPRPEPLGKLLFEPSSRHSRTRKKREKLGVLELSDTTTFPSMPPFLQLGKSSALLEPSGQSLLPGAWVGRDYEGNATPGVSRPGSGTSRTKHNSVLLRSSNADVSLVWHVTSSSDDGDDGGVTGPPTRKARAAPSQD